VLFRGEKLCDNEVFMLHGSYKVLLAKKRIAFTTLNEFELQ